MNCDHGHGHCGLCDGGYYQSIGYLISLVGMGLVRVVIGIINLIRSPRG